MMKGIGIFVLVIFGLMILTGLSLGLRAVLFPVKVLENEIKTSYDAVDKVINADNAIYNYEWFKQKKENIDASKKMLDNARNSHKSFFASLPESRVDWGFEDKTEDARLRSVILGLENNLEQQIADYNARTKMATRNIFEDKVLPDFIDALTFIRQ